MMTPWRFVLPFAAGLALAGSPAIAQDWLRADPYNPRYLEIDQKYPFHIASYANIAAVPTACETGRVKAIELQVGDLVAGGATYVRLWNWWTTGGVAQQEPSKPTAKCSEPPAPASYGPYLASCPVSGQYNLDNFNDPDGASQDPNTFWGRLRLAADQTRRNSTRRLVLEVPLFLREDFGRANNPFENTCSHVKVEGENGDAKAKNFQKVASLADGSAFTSQGFEPTSFPPEGCYAEEWNSDRRLLCYQQQYVRKMIDATSSFGNVILEIMNEPAGTNDDQGRIAYFQKYWAAFIKMHAPTRLVSAADRTLASATPNLDAFDPDASNRIDIVNIHKGLDGSGELTFLPTFHELVSEPYLHAGWRKVINVDEFANGEDRPWALRKAAWTITVSGGHFHVEDVCDPNGSSPYCDRLRPHLDALPWQTVASVEGFKSATAWRFDRGTPAQSTCDQSGPCFYWMHHGQSGIDQDGWAKFGVMDHVGYLARLHTPCGLGSLTSYLPAAPDGTDYVARLWDPVTRDFVRRNGYVREYRFSHPSAGNVDWCAAAAFRDVIDARVNGLSTQPHTEDLTFLVRATKPSKALDLEALDPPCRLLDTRTPPTTHLRRGELGVLDVAGVASGSCGGRIPAGAQAVALTVTAVQPSHQGHVNLHLPGTDPRATSVVNFMPGQTVAGSGHFLLTPLGKLGVSAWATDPAATIPLVIDVTGYFVENVKEARQ